MNSWIDGRPATAIDHRDRGLHYGDGVFETMRVRHRSIRFLDFHLERLSEACRRLQLIGPPATRLRRELVRIAALRPEGVLKVIVTRGIGPRGYRPSPRARCTRIISLHPLPRTAAQRLPAPVRVRMCALRLGRNDVLAGLKTLNRLESVLARAEWRDPRIWEGLLQDQEGNIVCGTMSNVFMRRGSRLLTPRVDRCGIAGVMRRWVLSQAAALGLEASECRLRWQDLERADEAFLTNAVAGIVPIKAIQQGRSRIQLAEHPVSAELHRRLVRQ